MGSRMQKTGTCPHPTPGTSEHIKGYVSVERINKIRMDGKEISVQPPGKIRLVFVTAPSEKLFPRCEIIERHCVMLHA
jgi:hypothetical protein